MKNTSRMLKCSDFYHTPNQEREKKKKYGKCNP